MYSGLTPSILPAAVLSVWIDVEVTCAIMPASCSIGISARRSSAERGTLSRGLVASGAGL